MGAEPISGVGEVGEAIAADAVDAVDIRPSSAVNSAGRPRQESAVAADSRETRGWEPGGTAKVR